MFFLFFLMGLDLKFTSWDKKNGILLETYPYSLIPNSKLANPVQTTSKMNVHQFLLLLAPVLFQLVHWLIRN